MFRPARLIVLAALGLLVYTAFYATPQGAHGAGAFDPEELATRQIAVWQSVKAKEEFSLYVNTVRMLREEHQYTWYKAGVAGWYLSRALYEFAGLQTRFERVLPDLEAAAAIERDWHQAKFDPALAARAQLTWWVTSRTANLNSLDNVGPLAAQDLALRYQVSTERMMTAAMLLAQATELRDAPTVDPNWRDITRVLLESDKALHNVLTQTRTRAMR
jgi:hypothetical protein